MRRRTIIAGLGSAAAWPVVGRRSRRASERQCRFGRGGQFQTLNSIFAKR